MFYFVGGRRGRVGAGAGAVGDVIGSVGVGVGGVVVDDDVGCVARFLIGFAPSPAARLDDRPRRSVDTW